MEAAEKIEEQSTSNPACFCFSVEMHEGSHIVTICSIKSFERDGYLDDTYDHDIGEILQDAGFFPFTANTFEPDTTLTAEQITDKMIALGFVQHPLFDKYISETQTMISPNSFWAREQVDQ